MKLLFFKFAPTILAAAGLLGGLGGFLLDAYAPAKLGIFLWSFVSLVQLMAGFALGKVMQKLHYGMYHDALTGLRNRFYFYERMAEEMERMKRTNSPLSLAIIDVDNFKSINDRYGHMVGDKVLKQLAVIFENNVRASDCVVRWGGEEFAVILPGTDHQGALRFAERIRKNVESFNFFIGRGTCFKVTVSAGIATIIEEQMDLERVVELADKALYKAKEKKNSVAIIEGALIICS